MLSGSLNQRLPACTRRPSTLKWRHIVRPSRGCEARTLERRLILFRAAPQASPVKRWNRTSGRRDQASRVGVAALSSEDGLAGSRSAGTGARGCTLVFDPTFACERVRSTKRLPSVN
jgi:hypothetical protein